MNHENIIKLCSNSNFVSIISSLFVDGSWLFIQTGINILLIITIYNSPKLLFMKKYK